MKKLLVFLAPAVAALALSACGQDDDASASAAPAQLSAPAGTSDSEWREYLRQVVTANMSGVTGQPYMYYLPAPPPGTASPEEVTAAAEGAVDESAPAGDAAPSIASTGEVTDGTDYESVYTRQLENVSTVVARTVPAGNMLAFGSPDSERIANLVVSAFNTASPGSLDGVQLLFVGQPEDAERVAAAVEESGVIFTFHEAR